jgi:hypothetical protein
VSAPLIKCYEMEKSGSGLCMFPECECDPKARELRDIAKEAADAGMRGRLAFAIAKRNVARGHALTDEERLANLRKALDATTDVVLAYRPKPKSAPAKKRKRRAKKLVKARG